MPSVFGDSLHHRPMFDIEKFMQLTSFIEGYWLIQNKMDKVEIPKVFKGIENWQNIKMIWLITLMIII